MTHTLFFRTTLVCLLMFTLGFTGVSAQKPVKRTTQGAIDTEPFGDSTRHWYGIADKGNIIQPKKNQPRYEVTEVSKIADNILLYQRNNGGWPKNYDMQAILTPAQKDSLVKTKHILHTTIDNSTSYTHVDYLAQAYTLTKNERYKKAALHGIEYLISAQYANGGWPQYYPIEPGRYSRYITFNDGAYIGVMDMLQKIVDGYSNYSFLDEKMRKKAQESYEKGLDCILKCQILDMGVLTVWCQQHDDKDLSPAWARAFEPPSICNGESSEIVLFLMRQKNSSPAIVRSVKSAVAWFKASEIHGVRVKTVQAPPLKTPFRITTTDRVVVNDSLAPTIWTRYYELETHRPLFCDRNSKFLYKLSDVSRERRSGYGWYTYAPQEVLNKYPEWLAQHP